MEDVAEGLAEVAPHTDALRAESPTAAIELLQTIQGPDFAIIDAPGESEVARLLSAVLTERGTTIALVAHDGVAVPRAVYPVLDRPYGYTELQSFLIEMLEMRPTVSTTPQTCGLYRPEIPGEP